MTPATDRPQDTRGSFSPGQDFHGRAEKMQLMGEMASGVVHDFNNLLGAIIGRAQLSRCKNDIEEIKKQVAQIEKIALQGGETVKRLQSFTRRGQENEFQAVNLSQVVEDALEVTHHRWETQAQKDGIVYDLDRDLAQHCLVSGIHSDLVDVVANLIFNALDAMPEGGPLSISTRCEDSTCALTLADQGVGMSPDQIEEIFYPFYTTKGSHGTGLGLAVAYGVISRHNGEIRVESEIGVGSRFIISLPGTTSHVQDEPKAEPELEEGGFHILLVDDDHTILDVMGEALREAGHEVETFDNGAAAIVAMNEQQFDVIVTDLGMPGITGWEVARRAHAHNPPLPVVVISGWGAQLTDKQLSENKVEAVLAKPFHLEQLRDTIRQVVREFPTPAPQ